MAKEYGRSKNAFLNIIFSILLQLITVVSGLILPRIRIESYGSDVNGLISSITQFLSYITLLEGGIGGVINASLYKPLAKRNMLDVSVVINTAKDFYKKIAYIFIFYIAVMCALYPFLLNSGFDKWYIICFILVLSIGTILKYFFSLSYISLLTADQKGRINSIITAIVTIINVVVVYVAIKLKASALVVEMLSCLVFAIKPIFYVIYIKKHYALSKTKPDSSCISQRWNGFAHHIAYFIHSNTDVVIITLFMEIKYASVYAIYFAIISGLKFIITSISGGTSAGIGNLLAEDNKQAINRVIDTFEFVQFGLTTMVYTICAIMIIPFMQIYTNGITDVNYIQPIFAYILILSECFYCIRLIYSTVTNAAGHFKGTWPGAALEAILNVVLSIILIQKFGLTGIALGTTIGMFSRVAYEVFYLSKNILYRSVLKCMKAFGVNILVAVVSILICGLLPEFGGISLISWAGRAIIVALITSCTAFAFYMVFYKKTMANFLKTLLSLLPKKN